MFRNTLAAASVIAMTASGALAVETTGTEFTLGWDRLEGFGGEADGIQGAVDTELMFNNFGLGLGAGFASPDSIGGLDTILRLSATGNYYFGNGGFVGAFFDYTKLNGPGPFDGYSYLYGLQGGFRADRVEVTAFYGVGDYDDLGAPSHSDAYGVDFNYAITQAFDIGAYYVSESVTGTSVDQYGLTVGYNFGAGGSAAPVYLVGGIGRMDLDGTELDQFSLAVRMPIGGEPSKGRASFHHRSAFNNTWGIAGGF
ncbi:hypothetical protein [Shimia biformata]|uniref:hypothetical protein n=1 Tax=Shimia biformata TaxID=1294299 RepID=UPI00194DF2BE|nr:hypothetical protein [Shimia biformata]